jgi:hypothetical protein
LREGHCKSIVRMKCGRGVFDHLRYAVMYRACATLVVSTRTWAGNRCGSVAYLRRVHVVRCVRWRGGASHATQPRAPRPAQLIRTHARTHARDNRKLIARDDGCDEHAYKRDSLACTSSPPRAPSGSVAPIGSLHRFTHCVNCISRQEIGNPAYDCAWIQYNAILSATVQLRQMAAYKTSRIDVQSDTACCTSISTRTRTCRRGRTEESLHRSRCDNSQALLSYSQWCIAHKTQPAHVLLHAHSFDRDWHAKVSCMSHPATLSATLSPASNSSAKARGCEGRGCQ